MIQKLVVTQLLVVRSMRDFKYFFNVLGILHLNKGTQYTKSIECSLAEKTFNLKRAGSRHYHSILTYSFWPFTDGFVTGDPKTFNIVYLYSEPFIEFMMKVIYIFTHSPDVQ